MAARRRYVIGAYKITPEGRDVAHDVLPGASYRDAMHSDDDPNIPLGSKVVYTADLTEEEAERFRAASNARYVVEDGHGSRDVTPGQFFDGDSDGASWVGARAASASATAEAEQTRPLVQIPRASTMQYMGADQPGRFTGDGVRVCVLDGGTTDAVRARQPWTMVGKRNFGDVALPANGIRGAHGCYVTPEMVPDRGELLEGVVTTADGGGTQWSWILAGVIWGVDNGARIINVSFSSEAGHPALIDAIEYAAARGVQIVASAGNQSSYLIRFPAAYSRTYRNVHSIGNFDEATDRRWETSNYHEDLSGVTPGYRQLSLNPDGDEILWTGTSSSSPKAGLLIAMGMGTGEFTAQQVADALRASARDTGAARRQQGNGAWNLANAIAVLTAGQEPEVPGVAGPAGSWYALTPQTIPVAEEVPVLLPLEEYPADVVRQLAPGLFEVTADATLTLSGSLRIARSTGYGYRGLSLGNDLPLWQSGARRWNTHSGPHEGLPRDLSVSTNRRFAAGDRFRLWIYSNAGAEDVTQPVINEARGYVSLSVARIG